MVWDSVRMSYDPEPSFVLFKIMRKLQQPNFRSLCVVFLVVVFSILMDGSASDIVLKGDDSNVLTI